MLFVQSLANRPDAAIHHVRRCNDVSSRSGLSQSRFRQQAQRLVVGHVAIAKLAAMAVRSILTETEVGDDKQIWQSRLNSTNGLLHDAIFRVGVAPYFVFGRRQPEKQNCRNAKGLDGTTFLNKNVDREIENTWHGADLFSNTAPRANEERIDEVAW